MLTMERPGPAQGAVAPPAGITDTEGTARAAGKALRTTTPLDAHATFSRAPASRDPVTLLEEQAIDRVPELGAHPERADAAVTVLLLPGRGPRHGRRSGRGPPGPG